MDFQKNPRTDTDVARLRQAFPDPTPDGHEITHGQIEAVLMTSTRTQSRYWTVVRKWRAQLLKERGVWLDGHLARGRGFVVLTGEETVRCGRRGTDAGVRKVGRSLAIIAAPKDDQLTPETRHYRGRLQVAVVKILSENRETLREIGKALAPQPQLPREKLQ